MGSVRSVFSSQMSTDSHISSLPPLFNLIVDSGCTHHMFILREKFITYKPTPNSYVILANKSKVACLGSGTVSFTLFIENIILHDVLHVPKLCSPLLSVRCFHCLPGCSFIADNNGSFLTFPQFILPVNDSSDCTIAGPFVTVLKRYILIALWVLFPTSVRTPVFVINVSLFFQTKVQNSVII